VINKIRSIIAQGEGVKVEFKRTERDVPRSLYETVCAFLNTKGGDILLGVADNGEIVGIDPNNVFRMKQDFATTMNNIQRINPPFYLNLQECEIDGKTILHVFVPESSQVHRLNGVIYIRNHDSDIDITSNQVQVHQLYNQKSSSYSENTIFPAVTIDDLRPDLFERVRHIVSIRNGKHPWLTMDNMQLLQTMGLHQKNLNTGQTGFTLACILLFGKDEIIRAAVPAFRVDLIKRVENKDRYDDRDFVTTNLLDTYDRAMAFIEKHLPSPFFLENDERLELRSIIFREIIANAIVHKEYLGAEPTKIVIESDKVYTENSNKPYINGFVTPENIGPHPKNPTIARFFRELGIVEELGSGFTKLFSYARKYAGADPIIQDLPVFKFTLPISFFNNKNAEVKQVSDQVGDQVSDQVSDQARIVLQFCKEPKALVEIMKLVRFRSRVYFTNNVIKPLIEQGVLLRQYPDTPNHPNQKYVTSKGWKE
jgi:ATP-dependent DNA helicase RecG